MNWKITSLQNSVFRTGTFFGSNPDFFRTSTKSLDSSPRTPPRSRTRGFWFELLEAAGSWPRIRNPSRRIRLRHRISADRKNDVRIRFPAKKFGLQAALKSQYLSGSSDSRICRSSVENFTFFEARHFLKSFKICFEISIRQIFDRAFSVPANFLTTPCLRPSIKTSSTTSTTSCRRRWCATLLSHADSSTPGRLANSNAWLQWTMDTGKASGPGSWTKTLDDSCAALVLQIKQALPKI